MLEQPIDNNTSSEVILIQQRDKWSWVYLKELWRYRELIVYLVWRDIKVRYKQSVLGVLWVLLRPFIQMVIFTIIFSNVAKLPSEGIPYPIFNYAALVPWIFFADTLSNATTSLVGNANMIKKIYFPRLVLPIAASFSSMVDFFISLSLLFILMIVYGVPFSLKMLLLFPLLLLAHVTALGVSLWLAPLNVQFRDVRLATPFLIRIGMWLTPVAYSSSSLPAPFDELYALNPMAGVVEGFRWAMAGAETEPGLAVFISVLIVLGVFVSGLFFFNRMESTFADII